MSRSAPVNGPTLTPPDADSPPREESSRPLAAPQIPDYELLRCVGRGSYGDVWLARNVLGQLRAVKIIYRHRFADPRPFEREFEGIQSFEPISRSHPSQLHILHAGKNDAAGCFYYVMELADAAEPRGSSNQCPVVSNQFSGSGPSDAGGRISPPAESLNTDLLITEYSPRTLRSDLERHGRLPIPDCVQIGLSLATALAHLHGQGLVHRDIKSSNIIFVKGVAKLGDIGLVTDSGDTQSIVGTEGYLPPEGPGTPQADLYSLGKVLYEISTGLDRRRFAALPEDSWTWPDRDPLMEFNEIVLRACAKDPRPTLSNRRTTPRRPGLAARRQIGQTHADASTTPDSIPEACGGPGCICRRGGWWNSNLASPCRKVHQPFRPDFQEPRSQQGISRRRPLCPAGYYGGKFAGDCSFQARH